MADVVAMQEMLIEPALGALLGRLETLAGAPGFAVQRQVALGRALRLYLAYGDAVPLGPTAEEIGLARLYLYADFYPEDGQLSLVEQLRDTIEVHVPEDERAWLDPLRRSYMDLVEVVEVNPGEAAGTLLLRSLGDGRTDRTAAGGLARLVGSGQVLLTRVIRGRDRAVLPGVAVVLSGAHARRVKEQADEWRRELESEAGTFALGEWQEFAKRFGHILLWQLAQARLEALALASARVRYRTDAGAPFLYAMALYEHDDPDGLARGIALMEGWEPEAGAEPGRAWVFPDRVPGEPGPVVSGRLTLTPTQLWLECDGRGRLDSVKHELAATFGYRLHFRGEAAAPPARPTVAVDLTTDETPALAVTVAPEEARRLATAFLERCYLEWADLASPALDGLTPRHAAADPRLRPRVAALIDRMERDDPTRRRTGRVAYDYDRLRTHVGL